MTEFKQLFPVILLPATLAIAAAAAMLKDAADQARKRDKLRSAWRQGFEAGRREEASDVPAVDPEGVAPEIAPADDDPSDAVTVWAMDAVSLDAAGRVNVADAHRDFSVWAAVSGVSPLDVRTFGRSFNAWAEARGARRLKSHGAVLYQGLALDDVVASPDMTPLGTD